MLDKNKVKEFVKEHKKEIAIGAGVVTGVVLIAVGCKKFDFNKTNGIELASKGYWCKEIEKPELEIGTVRQLWEDHNGITTIVDDIKVEDMGKFGEELYNKIEGVTQGTKVNCCVAFLNQNE